jgi:N-acetylmuramic acid 6-phosphate (MurNAc-6-P) etherase
MQILMTCKQHPQLRWTKEIAEDADNYGEIMFLGAATSEPDVFLDCEECPCTGESLHQVEAIEYTDEKK